MMNAEEARQELLGILQPGDTVYSIVRHVTQSGMTRDISFFANGKDGLRAISFEMSVLFGEKPKERHGHWVVRTRGAGMDMAFKNVYDLSHILFKDGYALNSKDI
jgi:hypothetical protein